MRPPRYRPAQRRLVSAIAWREALTLRFSADARLLAVQPFSHRPSRA